MGRPVVFAIFVMLVVTLRRSVYGTCPRSALQALQLGEQCIAPLTKLYFSSGTMSSVSLQAFCHNSASGVATCLQKMFDDCERENPSFRRVIARAIDLDNLGKSLKYFCNNTHVLIDNKSCIDRETNYVTACVRAEYSKHLSKLDTLERRAYSQGTAWLADEIIKSLCIYNKNLSDCYGTTRRACGDEVADILTAIVVSHKPPGCSGQTGNRGLSIHGYTGLMFVTAIFCMVS